MAQQTKGSATELDIYVGKRLREIRTLRKFSQERIAEKLGITFQQVQKYEKGTNRIAAGRLGQLATILSTPVDYFFPAEYHSIASKLIQEQQDQIKTLSGVIAAIHQISGVRK